MSGSVPFKKEFISKLEKALSGELPGKRSHAKMASRLRRDELRFTDDTSTAVRSSVLILIYPVDGVAHTVFILRQTYDGVHSGQVSFPGGRAEPGDRDLIETALREASEEVGIIPEKVHILGILTDMYIPPSNFLVLPVVGYSEEPPAFVPDPAEVAEIIQADLGFLFDRSLRKETIMNVRGYEIEAPYFDVENKIIWGATAMILSELKDIIESIS